MGTDHGTDFGTDHGTDWGSDHGTDFGTDYGTDYGTDGPNQPLTADVGGYSARNYSWSNDIYLNATEEVIQTLLNDGVVSGDAFNFGFYTKMTIENDAGEDLTVNLKLTANDALTSFTMTATDIDVAVESFYNVAED